MPAERDYGARYCLRCRHWHIYAEGDLEMCTHATSPRNSFASEQESLAAEATRWPKPCRRHAVMIDPRMMAYGAERAREWFAEAETKYSEEFCELMRAVASGRMSLADAITKLDQQKSASEKETRP